ncbi:MAG: hypothetical protein K6T76_03260 [Alicyclobacillus mali]|uniref:hypothetical protein n=1 Tax=Alicyclobacillus mali (ex Roth et al. 2021) TaxID=1123961 RepID=UPI0023F21AC8|nr:hypothetical protein [Alicyclobacillus mali (ex Roth et al. 2021)]MCL6487944.1 hypothetical protein [Alicyclobacillus mali (ex Roth et al. 2021)]
MKLKRLGICGMFLFGTAAVLWGAQAAARAQHPPIQWRTVVVREPAPQPVARVSLRGSGIDWTRVRAWAPSPSRLAAFALEPSGEIRVFDLRTGRAIADLSFSAGVSAAAWASDRLLLILTGGRVLETYDVWNHVSRYVASLDPPAGMTCRALAWSGYTNDLYVIFSGSQGNEVYYFDTNEHMYAESLGTLSIRQAYDGATNLTLYVVDAHQELWTYRGGLLHLATSRVALIRGAGNTVYCAALNAAGEAVAVRAFDGHSWSTICRLPAPVPASRLVVDHAGRVYEVSRLELEDDAGRIARAPRGTSFVPSQSADAVIAADGSAYGVVLD